MNDTTKEKLQKAIAEADTITDGVLHRVSQSKWSWAILLVSHGIAFGLGAWLL